MSDEFRKNNNNYGREREEATKDSDDRLERRDLKELLTIVFNFLLLTNNSMDSTLHYIHPVTTRVCIDGS
jgi:hypothetical protein